VVVFVLLAVGVGMLVPVTHTATVSQDVDGTPVQVWAVFTDVSGYAGWRSDIDAVEVLDAPQGGLTWRESGPSGAMTFRISEAAPPRRWVSVIADENVPFGGVWTYELEEVAGGGSGGPRTRLTITEDGEIRNPFFRFVARFILGYDATMKRYVGDLAAHMSGGRVADTGATGPGSSEQGLASGRTKQEASAT
jgi:uncharacterized protein YndB with AHSA1/START domain